MADEFNDPINQRLSDGGPLYVETPPDFDNYPYLIAEPWNTCSAMLFVVIPVVWFFLLRGRYRDHAFLTMCLPILATGGVGGVLFHGLRRYKAFFLMDVVPIYLLGLVVTVWLWIRLGPRLHHLLGAIALLALLQMTAHLRLPTAWAINVSYASLALLILVPLAVALLRTRFRQAGWIYTSLACFAIAWTCRISDTIRPPIFVMGTHWLWHTFGALTTLTLSIYIFHIEKVPLRNKQIDSAVAVR